MLLAQMPEVELEFPPVELKVDAALLLWLNSESSDSKVLKLALLNFDPALLLQFELILVRDFFLIGLGEKEEKELELELEMGLD